MTYFGFLLRFLFIPILVFLAITLWENRNSRPITGFRNGRAVWTAIGIHILLAVLYTTPWDNYLVATGVWSYNPDLVTGIVIGYVPIEEYTFFVLETFLAGLWWWFLARSLSLTPGPPSAALRDASRSPTGRGGFRPNKSLVYLSTCVLILIWIVFTYLFFSDNKPITYLSVTLFWALPAILPQLFFGADILWHHRKFVAPAILVPATYLSLMDIIALKDTTWSISPAQTTGILFFGILPLEEVVFFLTTNMLITFGMTLLLSNVSQGRFKEIKEQLRGWKERRVVGPQ